VSGDFKDGYLKFKRAVCVRGFFRWVTELQESFVCQGIVQMGNSTAGELCVCQGIVQMGN
jgi:hypothetical protein